jgi:hypothetical protein
MPTSEAQRLPSYNPPARALLGSLGRRISAMLVVVALPTLAAACGSRSDYYEGGDIDLDCRERPGDCEGDIGGACEVSDDCSDGVCCRDKNCGRGMCTYLCDRNSDCPEEMACEHGYCFFRCSDDAQCGPGQSCEHGDTICEYDGD